MVEMIDRETVIKDLKWFKSKTKKANLELEDIPKAFFGYLRSPVLFHVENEVILPMPDQSLRTNHILIIYNPDKKLIIKTPLKVKYVTGNIKPPEEKEDIYWEKCKTYNEGSWKKNESKHCRLEIVDDHTVKIKLNSNVPARIDLEGYSTKLKVDEKDWWKVHEWVESKTQYLHLLSLETVLEYFRIGREVYDSLPIEEVYLKVLYSPVLENYLYCRYRIRNGEFHEGYIYVNLWSPTTPDPLKEPSAYVKADRILSIRKWENKTTWGGDWDKEEGMEVIYIRAGKREKQIIKYESSYSVQTGRKSKVPDKLGVFIPVYSYEEMIKKLVEHGVRKEDIEEEFSEELGDRLKTIL